ncbi:MAG: hypothetical protein JWO74_2128 [Solirubrobacterales bacterium]|jgi:hypothetical protein|nr:hypothetical protein [Solirubrobacterales bacterium]
MATPINAKTATEATTEHVRGLNERIVDAGKRAGYAYLDAYEKALKSIADYQPKMAESTGVEWVSNIADAQARFTRNFADLYVSTGRELLK